MSQRVPTKKESDLLNLFDEWKGCTRCPLGHPQKGWTRTQVVCGDGNANADIVVIGIAPGQEEDKEGVPFIGESGVILDDFIQKAGIVRDNIWVMNTVQCRPTGMGKDFYGRSKVENRNPTTHERTACRPFWERMLYIVDPLLVIALGQPACQEVASTGAATMHDLNGTIREVTIKGNCIPISYSVMCMYHPAFLSRTGDMFEGGPWHQVLVAWRRAVYYVDRMKSIYFGDKMPNRGFGINDLYYKKGEI